MAKVLLVATHPDTSRTPRTLQGNYISTQAERLLTQLTDKFGALFDIHQQVLIVDAHLSNSPGMRAIKSYLADAREKVLQVWLSENASVILNTFKLICSLVCQTGHLLIIVKWKILIQFHIFVGIGGLLSQDLNGLLFGTP